jgi:O-antigen ligase
MNKQTEIGINRNFLSSLVFIFIVFLATGLVLQNQRIIIISFSIAVLPVFLYFVFFRLKAFTLFTIFLIPLSVKAPVGTAVVSFPGEIFVLVIALFYIIYSLNGKQVSINKTWKHPITILIMIDLGWSLFTGLIGELPIISLKRLLIKAIFIIVFYFLFSALFRKRENLFKVWILYGLGMLVPIIWALYNHAQHDFSKVVSFVMPLPFYNDHTLYAACIAFILPVFILFLIKPGWFGIGQKWRLPLFIMVILLLLGVYFSFSRAAWISIIAAAISGLLIVYLRFKVVHFTIVLLVGLMVFSYYSRDIFQNIQRVDDVSRKDNIEEHFRSVMNIQTDASNLERINRWQCALRMFRDRPLTGFGPGTYLFVYGKYQATNEMTRISTNHGEKGNAHSEYLMYLSETGLPGLLIFILLIYFVLSSAIKIFNSTSDKALKWFTFSVLLGIITFLVHGTFNSFIDTDKAAVLFYAALAAIVSIDQSNVGTLLSESTFGDADPGE